MATVAYLSHSLGTSTRDADLVSRQDHISEALDWYAWLHEVTPWCIVMPWFPSVVALNELHLPRAKTCQRTALGRCDILVLAGVVISPDMKEEVELAKKQRQAVIDLTDFGRVPPRDDMSAARSVLVFREREARAAVLTLEE